MPIEIQCPQCGKRLKAPDSQLGKQAKCPQCQNVFVVEQAQTTAASIGDDPPQWHVKTGEGDQYGPVTKAELDAWVKEGRLDSGCQVLKGGWARWQWAEQVYPGLGRPVEPTAAELSSDVPSFGDVSKNRTQPNEQELKLFDIPATTTDNPFRSPQSNRFEADYSGEGAVTPRTRQALAETKPWVTFLSVLGFIIGGLMAIGTVGMLVGMGVVVAAIYGVMAAMYIACSYYLLSYGRRIGDFLRSGRPESLEAAMLAQRTFWKVVGVVVALFVVLWVLMMIFGAGMAMFL